MRTISEGELLKTCSFEVCKQAAIFGALSKNTIVWLLREGKIYALDDGDILFEPGSGGDSFYIVLDGSIAYYKYHDGEYAYIKDYEQGEEVGFVSTIALHDRVGKTVARGDTRVLEIDCALFYRFHEEKPTDFGLLMMNLARDMARMIRRIDNIVVQTQKSAAGSGEGL